jgi:hypothetical protein
VDQVLAALYPTKKADEAGRHMSSILEELEDRVTKRREVDMIVKMRIDQLQRENSFVSSAKLDAVLRVAEEALARVAELEKRLAALQTEQVLTKR